MGGEEKKKKDKKERKSSSGTSSTEKKDGKKRPDSPSASSSKRPSTPKPLALTDGTTLGTSSSSLALIPLQRQSTTLVDDGFAADFTDKKFFCESGEQMGFVFRDNVITKVVPGRWADRSGLREFDEIVLIQTDFSDDEVVETYERKLASGAAELVKFTPFLPLSQRDKIIRLKRKPSVGFVIARGVNDNDVDQAARNMQAAFRGRKDRDFVKQKKENTVWGWFSACCGILHQDGSSPSIDCLAIHPGQNRERVIRSQSPPPPLIEYYPPLAIEDAVPSHISLPIADEEDMVPFLSTPRYESHHEEHIARDDGGILAVFRQTGAEPDLPEEYDNDDEPGEDPVSGNVVNDNYSENERKPFYNKSSPELVTT
ncbi:unnamed protein product [Amoebophrya sp. A120]|nr:unnamed protein product [Amoebophrya sp. A120]|eukprot:GSA120T00016562001.1